MSFRHEAAQSITCRSLAASPHPPHHNKGRTCRVLLLDKLHQSGRARGTEREINTFLCPAHCPNQTTAPSRARSPPNKRPMDDTTASAQRFIAAVQKQSSATTTTTTTNTKHRRPSAQQQAHSPSPLGQAKQTLCPLHQLPLSLSITLKCCQRPTTGGHYGRQCQNHRPTSRDWARCPAHSPRC
jgi:hypothetical protein